jgi:hypothetical protein
MGPRGEALGLGLASPLVGQLEGEECVVVLHVMFSWC